MTCNDFWKKRGFKMNYPFECKCGHKEIISMPIKDYHADKHFCPICGTEMVREVKSLVCGMSIDTTNTFFRKIN